MAKVGTFINRVDSAAAVASVGEGTVVFDLGHQAWSDTDDTVYAWIKCNNGTVTVDLARLIWSE
jgi:hypothetical protein